MNYQEFCSYVKENILSFMPESYRCASVTVEPMKKVNSTLDGLVIKRDDQNIIPVSYLNDWFGEYSRSKDLESVMHDIARSHLETMKPEHLPDMTKEEFCQKGFVSLINYADNIEFLNNMPYQRFQDLALIPKMKIGDEETVGYCNINYQILDMMGLTPEEAFTIGTENLKRERPPILARLDDTIQALTDSSHSFRNLLDNPSRHRMPADNDMQLYLLFNNEKYGGAAYMTDREILSKASECLGGSYAILPSSIHELILIPEVDSMCYTELQQLVSEINRTQVEPQERLSNTVYRYDAESKIIEIAASEPQRQRNIPAQREEKRLGCRNKSR